MYEVKEEEEAKGEEGDWEWEYYETEGEEASKELTECEPGNHGFGFIFSSMVKYIKLTVAA